MSEEMEKSFESDEQLSNAEAPIDEGAEAVVNENVNENAHWYVVHTYSGYENKVKANLESAIINRHLEDQIFEVRVPLQDVVEVKNGVRKNVQRKMFPGYVLVNMDMNDETWYVVRNTRGVTGFVGPGSKPIPLKDEEVVAMGVERIPIVLDIEEGESVRVVNGPLENFIGKVEKIDVERQKVKLTVSMFGRETPVELDFIQVQKL